jgi:hypothetical protein
MRRSYGNSPNTLRILTMQVTLSLLLAKLSDLVEQSQKVGLRVNIEKTKDLRVNNKKYYTEASRI